MITLQDGSAHLPRRPLLRSSLFRSSFIRLSKTTTFAFICCTKNAARVRNQLFCPVCKVVIERDETVLGYEVTKGQNVRVDDVELEALEAEANSSIDMSGVHPDRESRPNLFREQLLSRA